MSENAMPKPWQHRLLLSIDRKQTDIEIEGEAYTEVAGMVAACTCGDFTFRFAEGADSDFVRDHVQPHFDTHPLAPLSIAEVGDGQVVMVMAVPGPEEDKPVHMTISVPKATFDDGALLGKHLGPIGSPVHFQSNLERRRLFEHGRDNGFRMVELPFQEIGNFFDMINRVHGESVTPEHRSSDPSITDVPLIDPDQVLGFLQGKETDEETAP